MLSRGIALPFCLVTLPLLAADWPRFRGPDGSGVSTEKGLPVSWSAKENVVWKTDLLGSVLRIVSRCHGL
jgi:outer membrane protein assembly factor BamB